MGEVLDNWLWAGSRESRNRRAVAWMAVAVLFFSFLPLAIRFGGGLEAPFLFNAGWRVGVALVSFAFCLAFYRRILCSAAFWRAALPASLSWAGLFSVFNALEYAFFAAASRFIDIAVAAVLLELWPLAAILLLSRLLPEQGYRRNLRRLIPFLFLAFLGVGLVVASQQGGFSFSGFGPLALGLGLGLLSMLASAAVTFNFRWAREVSGRLRFEGGVAADCSPGVLQFFGAVAGFGLASVFGAALNGGIGLALGESLPGRGLAIAVAGGFVIQGIAAIFWRVVNLTSDNLGINAMAYFIPVCSLGWLGLAGAIGVARPDWLLGGLALILAANLLILFERPLTAGGQRCWRSFFPVSKRRKGEPV